MFFAICVILELGLGSPTVLIVQNNVIQILSQIPGRRTGTSINS